MASCLKYFVGIDFANFDLLKCCDVISDILSVSKIFVQVESFLNVLSIFFLTS